MTPLTSRVASPLLLLGFVALCVGGVAAQQADEELAERRFQSGIAFLRDGNYQEALEDFDAVTSLYPLSSVADNALLEIARYHLDVGGNVDQAILVAEGLVNDPGHAQADAVPEAQLILARVALMRSRTEAEIQDAVLNFRRWLRLYPDTPAVPQALFYVGEGYRLAGRSEEALAAYRRVVTEHPSHPWAIRARLDAGQMAALVNDPISAMEEFQRVRDEFPDRPEATDALARTTILYRLFVKPGDAPYAIRTSTDRGGRTSRDVIALAALPDGNVVIATDRGISSLRPTPTPLPAVAQPRGLGVDPDGTLFVIDGGSLRGGAGQRLQFVVPRRGGDRALREVDAVAATSTGDWLVADREAETIQRFSHTGTYLGPYAAVRAERLAIGPLDRVAVLDNDERIYVYDAGERIAQISSRVANSYRIDNPVDLGFDVFGHLYVLDREGVFIFDRERRLLKRFPASENARSAFDRASALAIDPFGRLYVADRRDHVIFVLE